MKLPAVLLFAATVIGCGRLGFDSGGGPDAAASAGDCPIRCTEQGSFCLCLDEVDFGQARDHCFTAGLTIATIASESDNGAMNDAMVEAGVIQVWIGATDQAEEGQWRWQDGTQFWSGGASGVPVGDAWVNWGPGQPNNLANDEHCAEMRATATWNDTECTRLRPFLCN